MAPSKGDVMVRVGGVLSRLITREAVAVLPARSRAVPEIAWLAPSVLTRMGPGQKSIPLSESEHVNVAVTLELFHPAALGGGLSAVDMTGGVLSTLTITEALATLPALSRATPEMT